MDASASRSHALPLVRRIRGLSGTAYEELEAWPTPDEGGLGDDTSRYLQRKRAVQSYLQGASDAELKRCFSLSLKRVYCLITTRCLKIHPDGSIYGWRGLVPNLRIEPYTRKHKVVVDPKGRGASGAMQSLLDLNPDLRKAFDKRILAVPRDDTLTERHTRQGLWRWFLEQLTERGYKIRNDWPFNTENCGYVSVCRYVNAVLMANPAKGAMVEGGIDAFRKLKSGDGVDRPVHQLFQRVEMDAHKLDGRFCVLLPRGDGIYVERIVHRLWVIVLLEIISRAIIGYYFSYRYEISKNDVLRAIKRALTTWRPRLLAFGDIAYREGAALPSGHAEKYVGVCWDETSVDGAMAERCGHVRGVLKDLVGSQLIEPATGFSVRRAKDDRPYIETFFNRLASGGFHRLSNTTGGKPQDKRGANPDKVAIASRFQVEYAEDLLDVLIANYNASSHAGLGDRSPLEYLDFLVSRPGKCSLRYADRGEVERLLSYRKTCSVRGSLVEGRRPYVNFSNAEYHGDILGQRFDLIGKKIWVENHIEYDARVALAYTIKGESLGVLRAAPPWHGTPHSLEVRAAIVASVRHKQFQLSREKDGIQVFMEFYETSGRKLPVHPMYLECRRILALHAPEHLGDSVLADAASKLNADVERQEEIQRPATGASGQSTQLPARRMARTG